ncbi:BTAD domain-containing putative transcriptional regulator [Dactylosporangium sp. NPDC049525]|uniref:BTAD domain-containing putative transcriptional regulator n=1 Tax=Dactylosporangium sp. NPDC049525 TaxID=3154730 RepID=UPI003419B87C
MKLQILGPLRVWRDDVELNAGPRQQAYLLAVLLAHAGRPISTSALIDLLWGDDVPASAMNIVHKYVGALRRVLEPTLPSRDTGRFLLRHGDGYLFAARPGMVDVATFQDLVRTARTQRHDQALTTYIQALELWRGRAGDGLSHEPTAAPVFSALDDEFFDACVTAAHLAVQGGRPEQVLRPVRLAAWLAPLHEPVQAALVNVLAATDRQAEALSTFQCIRARLAKELGVHPGPALRAAHQDVLRRTIALTAAHRQPPTWPAADGGRPATAPPRQRLAGRTAEMTVLRRSVDAAFAGETAFVVVEGEPGAGKSRLLEEIAGEARERGALVAWGRCLAGEGTPALWPWTQVARALPEREGTGDPAAPAVRGGFRQYERVVARIGAVSAERPVVLVVDDLQWADPASLDMLNHLAARLPAGTVVVAALRDRAPTPDPLLTRTLAVASRLPTHRRIRLGPLSPDELADMVRQETGREPADGMHARTGGNPFLVRELCRYPVGVPSTVRDVVRDRTAGLDDDTRDLLWLAALIGREVDVALLACAAGIDGQTCLDHLDPLEALGVLEPCGPFSVRFRHDLVRESIAAAIPRRRAAALHLRIVGGLDGTNTTRMARHLWAAGPLGSAILTSVVDGR